MSNQHPWCRDVQRDTAIRAAEDAAAAERTPLPDHRDLPKAVAELRERVARLEAAANPWPAIDPGPGWRLLAHDEVIEEGDEWLAAPAYLNVWWTTCYRGATPRKTGGPYRRRVAADATLGSGDVFADVGCGSTADEIVRLTAERDAAREECERLKARVAELEEQLESVACRAATAENRVSDLEAAAKLAPAANADGGSNHAAPAASGAAGTEPEAWAVRMKSGRYKGFLFESEEAAQKCAELITDDTVPLYAAPRVAELEADRHHIADASKMVESTNKPLADGGRPCDSTGGISNRHWCQCPSTEGIESGGTGDRAAPTATAGGGGKSEPVAWGIVWKGNHDIDTELVYLDEESAQETAKENHNNGTVTPLYAAPQPPRGWLTEEEREAVEEARDFFDGDNEESSKFMHRMLSVLLARSSPPEVVLPRECGGLRYDSFVAGWNGYRDEVKKALAAAGVKWKEVWR